MFELFNLKEVDSISNKIKIDNIKSDMALQFMEMSKTKTRFEIEKMLVAGHGNFIATQFHDLMKQYRIVLNEYEAIAIELEELKRWVAILHKEEEMRRASKTNDAVYDRDFVKSMGTHNRLDEIEHIDLEIKKSENKIAELNIDIKAHLMLINDFEDMSKRLIELNGNKEFTAEQYENEQPAYHKWLLASRAVQGLQSQVSGIRHEIIDAYYRACREPIIPESIMKIDPVVSLMSNERGDKIPLFDISKICKDATLTCDPIIPEKQTLPVPSIRKLE